MSVRPFLDSNVVLYAFAANDRRRDTAQGLLAAGGIVSVQVLNEFVNVARKKLLLDWREIERAVAVVLEFVDPPLPLTLTLHRQARTIARRYRFAFYDALIVAAAAQAKCPLVYSEDMQHGMKTVGLTIRNPFLPS